MRKELAAITSQTRRPLNVNFSAMYCLKQIPSESSLAAPATIVILTWPTNATGFALQSATSLIPSGAWSPVLRAPVVVNGQNTVTDLLSQPLNFYRLSQ